MNKKSKSIISILALVITLLLGSFGVYAQGPNQEVEMAGIMYQNGKIYLVVSVLATIFAGIIFQLIRLEIKLNKIEKKQS